MFNVIITASYDAACRERDRPAGKGPMKPFGNVLMNMDQDRRNAYWLMKACVVIIGIAVVSVVAIFYDI